MKISGKRWTAGVSHRDTPARGSPQGLSDLSSSQAKAFSKALRRSAGWLPKTLQQWKAFSSALNTGRSLPPKVTQALTRNFGWTNTPQNNNLMLRNIPTVVDELNRQLIAGVPVAFMPREH